MAGPGSGIRTELMGRELTAELQRSRSESIKPVSLSQPKLACESSLISLLTFNPADFCYFTGYASSFASLAPDDDDCEPAT